MTSEEEEAVRRLREVMAPYAAFGPQAPPDATGCVTDVWLMVITDMAVRRVKGLAEYGKPVTAADPFEDWLTHHYHELLDACVYVRAELERRKGGAT